MPFRETFTRWFGCIRFSIDVKIMCRVPICFLLAMARHMYRQSVVVMLDLEEEFETEIPDEEAEKLGTVQDAIDYIVAHT